MSISPTPNQFTYPQNPNKSAQSLKDAYGNSLDEEVPFYFGNELRFMKVDPASKARKEQELQQLSEEQRLARRDELEQDKPWLRDNFAYDPHTAEVLAEATAHKVLRDMYADFDKASVNAYNNYSDAEAVKGRADFQLLADSRIADALETFEPKPHLFSFVQEKSAHLRKAFENRNERIARERLTKAVNDQLNAARLPYLEALNDPETEPDVLEVASEALGLTMIAQGRFNKQTPDEYQAEYKKALEGAEQQRNLRLVKNLCESLNDTHKSFEIHRQTLQKAEGIYLQEKLVEAVGQRPKLSETVAKQAETAVMQYKLNPMETAAFKFQLGLAEGRLQKEEALSEEDVFVMAGRIKDVAQEALQKVEMEALEQQQGWKQAGLNEEKNKLQVSDSSKAVHTSLMQEILQEPASLNLRAKNNVWEQQEEKPEVTEAELWLKTAKEQVWELLGEANRQNAFRGFNYLKGKYPTEIAGEKFFDNHVLELADIPKFVTEKDFETKFKAIQNLYKNDPAQYVLTYGKNAKELKRIEANITSFFSGGNSITEADMALYFPTLANEFILMGKPVEEWSFFSQATRDMLDEKAKIAATSTDAAEPFIENLQYIRTMSASLWNVCKRDLQRYSNNDYLCFLTFALDATNTMFSKEDTLKLISLGVQNVHTITNQTGIKAPGKKFDYANIVNILSLTLPTPVQSVANVITAPTLEFLNQPKMGTPVELMQRVEQAHLRYAFTQSNNNTIPLTNRSAVKEYKSMPVNLYVYALMESMRANKLLTYSNFMEPTLAHDKINEAIEHPYIEAFLESVYGKMHFVSLTDKPFDSSLILHSTSKEFFYKNRITAIPDTFYNEKVNIPLVILGLAEKDKEINANDQKTVWFYTGEGCFKLYKTGKTDNEKGTGDSEFTDTKIGKGESITLEELMQLGQKSAKQQKIE